MSAGKVRTSPLVHLTWCLTRKPSMKTLVRMNHKISGVFTGRSTRYDLIESCAAAAAAARGNNTIDNALSWSKTADVRRAHVTRPRAIRRAADNGDNSSLSECVEYSATHGTFFTVYQIGYIEVFCFVSTFHILFFTNTFVIFVYKSVNSKALDKPWSQGGLNS